MYALSTLERSQDIQFYMQIYRNHFVWIVNYMYFWATSWIWMIPYVSQKLAEENSSNNAGVEHMKKMYARQRAKDLAEHAKSLLSKEKELDELRKQILSQQNDQVFPVWIMILRFKKWKCWHHRALPWYKIVVSLYHVTCSCLHSFRINPEYCWELLN